MKGNQSLLKELKLAYRYYSEDDMKNFDLTLKNIMLCFSGNVNDIISKIDQELGKEFKERRIQKTVTKFDQELGKEFRKGKGKDGRNND